MRIEYSNRKLEKQCTELKTAKKYFPNKIAIKLHKLINFIDSAESLKDVISMSSYNFHNLKGSRNGQYALNIDGRRSSYRLIVVFNGNENLVFSKPQLIKIIRIEEVSKHYE